MQTIHAVAERTGVPAHTLRAWERRYDVLAPARTPSGYRIYDDDTVARIEAMAALVASGLTASKAASEVRVRLGVRSASTGLGLLAGDSDIIEAAAAMDATAIARVLDERFSSLTDLDVVIDNWLMPTLRQVGLAWESGRVSVAGEHLIANAVMRRLAAAYEAAGHGRGRPVVLGAPPGVHHVVGLMAFGVVARRAGLATLYLGADVPFDAWGAAVEGSGAQAAVTVAPRRQDAARASEVVRRAETGPGGVPVWVGGRFQHLTSGRPLGHHLGEAVRGLASALAG